MRTPSRRLRARLLLASAALTLALLGAEGACRLWGVGSWDRTLMSVFTEPPFMRLPGYAAEIPRPGASCLWVGHEVRINPEGFRGPSPSGEDAGRLRLVAVGDSWTFGWGVGEEESWPAQVEQALRKRGVPSRVYNLGVPGMDTAQELRWLKERGAALRPDVVLLGFNADDVLPPDAPVFTALAELQRARAYRYAPWQARGGWRARLARVDQLLTRCSNLWRWGSDRWDRAIKARAARHAAAAWAGDDPQHYLTQIRDCYAPGGGMRLRWEAALRELEATCRDWGSGLVVVAFYPLDNDPALSRPRHLDLLKPLHEALDGRPGVRVVDLLDHLPRRDFAADEILIPYDGHPLAWVHAVLGGPVAEAALEAAREAGKVRGRP